MSTENTKDELRAVDAAVTGYACQACEDRAAAWLTAYLEEWNGPKARWTKKQKDQWCEYLGIITLFAKHFQFPTHTVPDQRTASTKP